MSVKDSIGVGEELGVTVTSTLCCNLTSSICRMWNQVTKQNKKANIATLSSVYHKQPETFVTRVWTIPKTEVFPEAEMPTLHVVEPSPIIITSSSIVQLCPLINPHHLQVFSASAGQGLQISAQLIRRDGNMSYRLMFENNTGIRLDGFMIQFNKNTFGLAAGSGTLEKTLVPIVMLQNIARGPPNSLLQVAIKNNQQPVWYFTDKVSCLYCSKKMEKWNVAPFLR
ncbi:hypothetical protein CTI12_AA435950 [Artemisia annua]|uniref:Uncharacterized protein n=1 Tax=Artemisia annua TaxID=35608 RepID=A0A2U1LZP3_ARTAN|nr:hypothetical protein CTI12_AA435950 [Artemisia annua]